MPGKEMHDDILECVGRTALVRLKRFCPDPPVLAAKIESFNPGASVTCPS
jgi:cysteine synthase